MGNKFRFTCERRFTSGNIRQPIPTSNCHFPSKLNLNQPGGRGWNLERQRCRIAIPVSPSATSVRRLYKACPLYVMNSFLYPAVWAIIGIIHDQITQNEATQRSITYITRKLNSFNLFRSVNFHDLLIQISYITREA